MVSQLHNRRRPHPDKEDNVSGRIAKPDLNKSYKTAMHRTLSPTAPVARNELRRTRTRSTFREHGDLAELEPSIVKRQVTADIQEVEKRRHQENEIIRQVYGNDSSTIVSTAAELCSAYRAFNSWQIARLTSFEMQVEHMQQEVKREMAKREWDIVSLKQEAKYDAFATENQASTSAWAPRGREVDEYYRKGKTSHDICAHRFTSQARATEEERLLRSDLGKAFDPPCSERRTRRAVERFR